MTLSERRRTLIDMARLRVCALALSLSLPIAHAATELPIEGIMDNSFLVEEAYNQEPGVVQHILTAAWEKDLLGGVDDRRGDFSFTQEWPVGSQTHQVSYTIPYSFVRTGGQSDNGVGDILLNYRYQAYFDEDNLTAFAPRLSVVFPTGDPDDGLGDDTYGIQVNLPFSTTFGDHWGMHANAGVTYLPDAGIGVDKDLTHQNVGLSAIYAPRSNLHLMVEWIGEWEQKFDPAGDRRRNFSAVISPGLRCAINVGDAQWVLGVAAPIGLTGAAADYGAILYVSFEHLFVNRAFTMASKRRKI